MSGDWIKMRSNLWDDPRITGICDKTGQSEAAIVGACYWLWATADQHSENGTLDGISLASIDRKTGIKGFAQAMVDACWLAECDGGVQLLRFEDHNGASAKKRAQTAKRVSTHRSNDPVMPHPESRNASSVTERQESVTGALAREEKRREEKRGTRLPVDWMPNDTDKAFCRQNRPDLLLSEVARSFYDYWVAVPGSKGAKLDWSATWRNWVMKESAVRKPPAPPAADIAAGWK